MGMWLPNWVQNIKAGGKCEELGENNLRLGADLAQEIAKTERQTREMEELAAENEANREKMQRSIVGEGEGNGQFNLLFYSLPRMLWDRRS
jgi:hypothetical protein